jgi:hypothetical protein
MPITIRKNLKFTDLLQQNLKSRYEDKRRIDNIVHVSDIIPTTCIRKQYYSRKFPELDPLSNESVHHFVRGESSEFVITQLASLGVAQANIEMDGIVAHPDIMNEEDVIVELKDTVNGKRLDINDRTFRAYLRQLLYYLVMTGIEKGIISIRYNIRELRWIKSDSKGNDYFFRPFNAKDVGIESWEIYLPSADIVRELIKNEMVRRKNLFLKALKENDVSILPRLPEFARNNKCTWCPFYDKCINHDNETDKAKEMANEIDLFDINGVIDFRPVVEKSEK